MPGVRKTAGIILLVAACMTLTGCMHRKTQAEILNDKVDSFTSLLKEGETEKARKMTDGKNLSSFGLFGAAPGWAFEEDSTSHSKKTIQEFVSFRKEKIYPSMYAFSKEGTEKKKLLMRVKQKNFTSLRWTALDYGKEINEKIAKEAKKVKRTDKAEEKYADDIMKRYEKLIRSLPYDEYTVVFSMRNGRLHLERTTEDAVSKKMKEDKIRGAVPPSELYYTGTIIDNHALSRNSDKAKSEFDRGMYLVDYGAVSGETNIKDEEHADFSKRLLVRMEIYSSDRYRKPVTMAFRTENGDVIYSREFRLDKPEQVIEMELTPEQLHVSDYFKVTVTPSDAFDRYHEDSRIGYTEYVNLTVMPDSSSGTITDDKNRVETGSNGKSVYWDVANDPDKEGYGEGD